MCFEPTASRRCMCYATEDEDELELPTLNEELRNFFMPRKAVAPEPEPAAEEVSAGKG